MKFSRKNKRNFLIYMECRGNTLYNEVQVGLQVKFSFMIEVDRIFLQLVEFQLALAHSLTPSHAQGGPNWLAVAMFEHFRISIVLNQALHSWLNQQVEIEQTSSESDSTSRGTNLSFFGGGCAFEGAGFHKRAWPNFVRGRDHKNFHLYPSPTFKVLTTPLAAGTE